jgi:ATP synthase protein I
VVLLGQALFTGTAMVLGAYLAGFHGAVSAGLGGAVSMASMLLFWLVASTVKSGSAGEVLLTAFRAEAVKIVFMFAALWLVMALYKDVIAVGFIGSFAVTVLISTMAIFVRPD